MYFVRCVLYIEMAANGMFGAGNDGLINPPDPLRNYTLSMAEIAVFNPLCYQVLMDLQVIIDLAKVISLVSPRLLHLQHFQLQSSCKETPWAATA